MGLGLAAVRCVCCCAPLLQATEMVDLTSVTRVRHCVVCA